MIKIPETQTQKTLRQTLSPKQQLINSSSDPTIRCLKNSPTPLKDLSPINEYPTFAPKTISCKNLAIPLNKLKVVQNNSPVYSERIPETSKLSKDSFQEIYQIKPSSGLKKHAPRKHFSGDVGTNSLAGLIEGLITIENNEGFGISKEKVKKYLKFFDVISEYFSGSALVLGKMKDFFTKLFYENIKLNKEIFEIKSQQRNIDIESIDLDNNLSTFEKLESSFSNKLIEENKILSQKVIDLQKDLNTLKSKEKQYQKFILFLKSHESNFEDLFKKYFSKDPSKKTPKFSHKSPDSKTHSISIPDEFIKNLDYSIPHNSPKPLKISKY
ncbi:hypothetical protein SteCoe_2012 [Stentor coeruleus]|uniref:Uncharacterized protein n=1 Tax=Stentor coeruleus TaxID=5963 RepID=A0A1R2D086_9CILI|nr:hypothetical protein SteCoe_2012 [Stentor coeruleus]